MFGKILKGLIPGGGKEKGSVLQERREFSRVRCDFEVECKMDRAEFRCGVQELSPGGLRLLSTQSLDPDSEILLSFRPNGIPQGRQRIRARVIWNLPCGTGKFDIGLRFVDSQDNMDNSWAYMQLRKLGLDPLRTFRRHARRFECNVQVQARDSDGTSVGEAVLVNIGQGGALMLLSGLVPPAKNTRLEVHFEDLKLFARVLGFRAGDTGFFVNLRFLNHPESAEIKQLGDYIQRLK